MISSADHFVAGKLVVPDPESFLSGTSIRLTGNHPGRTGFLSAKPLSDWFFGRISLVQTY